jgi:FixJ family two-component response regulator
MASPPIIAIIDDDGGIRDSLSSLIRSVGYTAKTYESAVEFLHDESDFKPDCMIVDVQMPVMSGDQLQERLKSFGRDYPMIFMTAYPTDNIRSKVMGAGATCLLVKPADGDTVLQCVERALDRHDCR